MKVEFNEPLSIRTSRGLVKDIHDPVSSVREPNIEYRTMLDLISRDTDLSTACEIFVDFATYRGYDFIRGTLEQRKKLRVLFKTKLDYDRIQSNVFRSLFYYGDCFVEMRKQDSPVPNELHVLETTEMRIKYDIHGKVEGYVQRPFNLSGLTEEQIIEKEKTEGIPFNPDEVIHFRLMPLGSSIYSYSPLEPASTAISTKLYSQNYLMNIFINMPPRYLLHLAGASERSRNVIKNELQSTKTNYKKPILVTNSENPQSSAILAKVDPMYDKELLDVMRYLRMEVLKVTRVPLSWVEESAGDNRGITESQQRPFDVRIAAVHRNVIEPQLNNVFLPALGYKTKGDGAESRVEVRYNEISRKGETEILQSAGLLRDMGLKPKAMIKYLDERGIVGFDENDFDEQQLRKNMELNPSRQRMDKSNSDMTQNRNEKGVSDKGGAKLQSKGVEMRSPRYIVDNEVQIPEEENPKSKDFNTFPYIY
ncbi:MAG: phage portal protein [Nanoarchaeota archaeon]|uniref:Putative portal protein n=1 Tax=viral metagenome TaxID=1070528 RepID=A0A6M3KYB4_9ZZZZ